MKLKDTFSIQEKLDYLDKSRKVQTNLDCLLKSSDITLMTKVHIVKAMIFPVVMSGYESWTIKEAEHWRIWCFQIVVLEKTFAFKTLEVAWTAMISNQSVLKEMNPDIHWKGWCWSWSSNILATWCEEPTHWKIPWCRQDWGDRRKRQWLRIRRLDGISNSMDMNLNKLLKIVKERKVWHAAVHGVTESWTWQRVGNNQRVHHCLSEMWGGGQRLYWIILFYSLHI